MSDTGQSFDDESRKREAEKLFEESIDYMTEREIVAAAKLGEEKTKRIEPDVPSPLETLWQEIKLLVAMLRDYVRGAYREIPFGSMAAVGAAVLYLASPIDAIPDFIPGVGYIDDAAVLVLCLRMVHHDIERYVQWQSGTVE